MCLGIAGLSATPVTLTGTYVEARTSAIFAGACVVNGKAATAGREALLAWKVDKGRFNGVPLDGMAVVAAVVGDANLSVQEIGGEVATTRTAPCSSTRARTRRSAVPWSPWRGRWRGASSRGLFKHRARLSPEAALVGGFVRLCCLGDLVGRARFPRPADDFSAGLHDEG
jgi:hypothetical protein